jgi:exodeoxyribonuclease-3
MAGKIWGGGLLGKRNMKIISWNVNGVRALIRKGGMDWILNQGPEVICLQEVKARQEQIHPEDLRRFSKYNCFWNPAVRPGYSGVATFTKQEPAAIHYGIGDESFDIEGRVIQSYFDRFVLFNIYFPNGQRDHGRLKFKLDFYSYLLELCGQMHNDGKNIILCGDFNTAHTEIDLANPKENVKTSGFLPEEREWIDRYIQHGFVDVYRWKYPEQVQYTWWTYRYGARHRNIGWRLDYFLVSETLLPQVRDVHIYDSIMGSDHCPISIEIEIE